MALTFSGPTDIANKAVLEHEVTRAIWSPGFCDKGQRVHLLVHAVVPDGTQLKLTVTKRGWQPETFHPKGFPATVTIQKGMGSASWQVDFDDVNFVKYQHVSLSYEARSEKLGIATVSVNVLEVGTPAVSVRATADQFAPKAEALDIQYTVYDPSGKAKAAVLRVYGNRYNGASYPAPGAIVYEQKLLPAEFAHGSHALSWRGECTCAAAPLDKPASGATRFVNPLFSPYVIEIELSRHAVPDGSAWPAAGTLRSFPAPENFMGAKLKKAASGGGIEPVDGEEAPELGGVEVLYDSIQLGQGSFLVEDKIPSRTGEKSQWALLLLNLLGYHAGPCDGPIGGPDAQVALRRFQHANYKAAPGDVLLPVTGNLDADTEASLARALHARAFFEPGVDPWSADARIFFDDNYGYGENRATRTPIPGYAEWNANDRANLIENFYFNRGWVPVQAKVRLKGRDGGPVFSPEAVGDVRVNFECDEPAPDETVILATNPNALTYVTNARTYLGAANTAVLTPGMARANNSGNNCPKAQANGFRDDDPAQYVKDLFEAGNKLKPFDVQFDQRAEGTLTIHFAWCKACTDEKFAPWLGRGGVYWRPGCKGGDGYELKARLDFKGQTNEEFLNNRHNVPAHLTARSGRLRVWRRTRIASHIRQNQRPARYALNWPAVVTEFRQGYLEFENHGQPLELAEYKDYVSRAEFMAILNAHVNPAAFGPYSASDLSYHETHVWGLPVPPQGASESAAQYRVRLDGLWNQYESMIQDGLSDLVRSKVRKKYAEGYIINDIRPFPPISIRQADGTTSMQLLGVTALGRSDYQVWMIETHTNPVPQLFPHEMAHCRVFAHGYVANTSFQTPNSHESHAAPTQMNARMCTMSYHFATAGLSPNNQHFCGKCVLKLRGWDELQLPSQYD